MEYTKGEWEVMEFEQLPYYWRIQTDKHIMAGVYSEANANLIAAAPDMYEACKLAIEVGRKQGQGVFQWFTDMEQALSKAEGK